MHTARPTAARGKVDSATGARNATQLAFPDNRYNSSKPEFENTQMRTSDLPFRTVHHRISSPSYSPLY